LCTCVSYNFYIFLCVSHIFIYFYFYFYFYFYSSVMNHTWCLFAMITKYQIPRIILHPTIFFSHTLFTFTYTICECIKLQRCFLESLGDTTGDDAGVKELQELRDKYEGKLTASLYTGTLSIAAVASLIALGAFCFTDYHVSTINYSPSLN